jgi:hypothetical protein
LRIKSWGGYLDLKGRIKLNNDELHSLYSSPNIVRVIKLRRMRWAGHVARMVEGRGVYRVLVGRPEGKRSLGVGGRITLSWTLGRWGCMGRTGFNWLRTGSSGGILWTRWWTFGFHKESRIFLDKLSDNQLFK